MMELNEKMQKLDQAWANPPGFIGWLRIVNQTNIGVRYIYTSLIFFFMSGVLGLMMRVQLASAETNVLGPEVFNQIFTVHGTAMMFLFAIPMVEGLGAYIVPLMIGTRDLSFPRLSSFSYFVFLIGGITLFGSLFMNVAPNAGWFDYVPLALKEWSPGKNIDVYATVITFIEISALAAAVELIVTILKQRAPGMTMARMPVFVWSILVMAFMIVFAMPGVIVGSVMLALDRIIGTVFFEASLGGDSLLWQHLFWWFGHPEVYIAFLPAAGVVSTIIPVFCKRPLYGYTAVVMSMVATGIISFGLWVHHMFTTGIPDQASAFFSVASAMIAIPSGIQIYCWIATILTGRPRFNTALLWCMGFVIVFVMGGLSGIMVASLPFDKQTHDTYFVVAHFHYVLIGGVVFPVFGGIYYWWPKFTGKLLNEKLGKINFWLVVIGFNIAFFPMHILGLQGMPRRIYTYIEEMNWGAMNMLSSLGAYLLGVGFFVFIINVIWTIKKGEVASNNPWDADTLEWLADSPPKNYKFVEIPRVKSLNPLWDDEMPVDATTGMRVDRREVLITEILSSKVQAVVILPTNSIWPFVLALATAVAFIGSIFSPWWFVVSIGLVFISITGWFWPHRPWDSGRDV
ncbi:MAG: cytochrome c oxidase subunit I [Bacteriovoracaceae bacterium]|nr:cytochrome c oxidase subunit I [Bacteriovoracaceae bacterium]